MKVTQLLGREALAPEVSLWADGNGFATHSRLMKTSPGWMPQHLGPRAAGCATSAEIQGFGGARFMPVADNVLLPYIANHCSLLVVAMLPVL